MNCSWLIIILLLMKNCTSGCNGNCSGNRSGSCTGGCTGGCSGASVRKSSVVTGSECDSVGCSEEDTSDGFSQTRYPMYGINDNDCGCRTQS